MGVGILVAMLFIEWLGLGLWIFASLLIALALLVSAYNGQAVTVVAITFLACVLVMGALLVISRKERWR